MTLISKIDFARRVGRSPSRVSHWIAEGKIRGDALVRVGAGDQINLEIALEQLGVNLDIVQQAAQERPLLRGLIGDAAADLDADAGPARAPIDDTDQRRLMKAKADAAETRAEQDRIALMAENGQWVRAAEVAAIWKRGIGDLLGLIEAELPAMAEDLAAELGGDPKAATIALRKRFRVLRQRVADEAAARRDALVPTSLVAA